MIPRDTSWNAASSRRRTWRARSRVVLIVLAVYIIIVGSIFAIFRTRLLRVQAVNINGTTYTDPLTIKNAMMAQKPSGLGRVAGFGNILAWPSHLSSSTRALIPSVQAITISKSYISRTITVSVVERQSVGIWCFAKLDPPSCAWFDTSGIAYGTALETKGSLIAVVHDTAQDKAGDDRKILPDELLPNFLADLALIQDARIPMREIDLTDLNKQEISVATYSGPMFYFSLRFPPTGIASVIDDLRHKGMYNGLQYLDFRSQNRAFYQ